MPEKHGEDDQCAYEIDEYTAQDDEHTLPSRFGAKFPLLGFRCQIFGGVRLIDHTGDGTIPSQREPSKSPLRTFRMFGPFVLFVLILGKELKMPFTIVFLHLDEGEPRIEEQVEFLHAHVEYLSEHKMPQLVNEHEKG